MRAFIAALIALVPPAWIALFVIPRVINVPIYDEWLWAPLALKSFDGTLGFGDLWAQQNAHRSVVSTALAMGLARISHWDTRWEIGAAFVVALATVALLVTLLPPARRLVGVPIFAWLVFGPAQIENWTWGFQLSWFLVNLGAVGAVAALQRVGWLRVALASGAALVASFSLVSGFAVWIGALVSAILARAPRARIAVLAGAALASGAVFLIGYRLAVNERADLASGGWLALPIAVPSLLGAPIAGVLGSTACAIVGTLGVLCAVVLARRAGSESRPWIALVAIAIVAATEIASARAGGGVDEMLTSRYVTLGSLLWIGIAGLVLGAPMPRGSLRLAAAGALALTAGLWIASAAVGVASLDGILALQRDEAQRVAAIAAGKAADLHDFTPDPSVARATIPRLKRAALGPFR